MADRELEIEHQRMPLVTQNPDLAPDQPGIGLRRVQMVRATGADAIATIGDIVRQHPQEWPVIAQWLQSHPQVWGNRFVVELTKYLYQFHHGDPAEQARQGQPIDMFAIPPWSAEMSDGCSASPDAPLGHDVYDACARHDQKYYYGGSDAAREDADEGLRVEMMELGAPAPLAGAYKAGVRIGGGPAGNEVGIPWAWGFGSQESVQAQATEYWEEKARAEDEASKK